MASRRNPPRGASAVPDETYTVAETQPIKSVVSRYREEDLESRSTSPLSSSHVEETSVNS
jgi:hypothetical protein